ncbi:MULTISPECIES: hypothetical protein [unclassified Acinetobacter]|uniref:hypothetical protein n=1 Tax=unclassified Acinetobacter TaxID=196816 RepID=UPI0015D24AB0|nr:MULTISPECIES: hypothetical protein [unclassified Acinetobacter]
MDTKLVVEVTNLNFKEILLNKEFQQNNNDYKHCNKYDKFCYHFILNADGGKAYFKKFLYLGKCV